MSDCPWKQYGAFPVWYPSAVAKRAALSLPTTQDANGRRRSCDTLLLATTEIFSRTIQVNTPIYYRGDSYWTRRLATNDWAPLKNSNPPWALRGNRNSPASNRVTRERLPVDRMELITILEKTVSPGDSPSRTYHIQHPRALNSYIRLVAALVARLQGAPVNRWKFEGFLACHANLANVTASTTTDNAGYLALSGVLLWFDSGVHSPVSRLFFTFSVTY